MIFNERQSRSKSGFNQYFVNRMIHLTIEELLFRLGKNVKSFKRFSEFPIGFQFQGKNITECWLLKNEVRNIILFIYTV